MNWDQTHNFTIRKLVGEDDYEGRVEATLISRVAKQDSKKAILYVHGFVDYFFHSKFADWANSIGSNFYAVDLRKYGRSLLEHQKPNNFRHYKEYFEDFDLALKLILEEDANKDLVLYGHSTGGLLTSLYSHYNKDSASIKGLILNSPFFDFNNPPLLQSLIPLVSSIGKAFPNVSSPEGLKDGYATSLHKDYEGEWDFNLEWKPILGYDLNLGWINAIHTAQKELRKGLEINCPILVMYSSQSVTPGKFSKEMMSADSVLNVKHIEKHALGIGGNVKKVEIQDGMHDLVLSKKDVREKVYHEMELFLNSLDE
jgi:alpha-beta hydrolase superfamily lysophospholipase